MTFVHDDSAWPDLLRIVAVATRQQVAMVEKDYWVTHALWALNHQGFELVHDYLVDAGELDSFLDNRPDAVRCVHPWVTCLEKLEAIARKFERDKAPADFVRHYEDAARIILRRQSLPATDLAALVATLAEEDGKRMPRAEHAAFEPNGSDRWRQIEAAWSAIQRLYWGPRISLEDATATLRAFLREIA